MHEPDNALASEEDLRRLFASADTSAQIDAQFVDGVLKRIALRERVRSLILGIGAAVATLLAAFVVWEFGGAWGNFDAALLSKLDAALNQASTSVASFLQYVMRSSTLLLAAALAVASASLARLLAD